MLSSGGVGKLTLAAVAAWTLVGSGAAHAHGRARDPSAKSLFFLSLRAMRAAGEFEFTEASRDLQVVRPPGARSVYRLRGWGRYQFLAPGRQVLSARFRISANSGPYRRYSSRTETVTVGHSFAQRTNGKGWFCSPPSGGAYLPYAPYQPGAATFHSQAVAWHGKRLLRLVVAIRTKGAAPHRGLGPSYTSWTYLLNPITRRWSAVNVSETARDLRSFERDTTWTRITGFAPSSRISLPHRCD